MEQNFESGMPATKTCVNWKVHNFSNRYNDNEFLKTLKLQFEVTNTNGVTMKWEAKFNFKVDNRISSLLGNPPKYLTVSVGLVSSSNGASSVKAKILAEISGHDGLPPFKGRQALGNSPKYEVGKPNFWTFRSLQKDTDFSPMLPPNGELKIKLNVTILEVLDETPNDKDLEEKMVSKAKETNHQLVSSLFNNKSLSDVRIISKDGIEYFAHRYILSAASDVFATMFRTNMTEKSSGLVKLEDLSGTAVKNLLHFIYTGKMAEDWKNPGTVEEVVYAADKYNLARLIEYLDVMLGKMCTIDNAAALLALVDSTGMKRATSAIMEFIKKHSKDHKGFLAILNNHTKGLQYSVNTVTSTGTNTDDIATPLSTGRATRKRKLL